MEPCSGPGEPVGYPGMHNEFEKSVLSPTKQVEFLRFNKYLIANCQI